MARVLVIEDESDLRALLAHNLERAGHEVAVAGDAAAGLALARERRRPDLVLLDLVLPDGSGLDVCRTLRIPADLGSRSGRHPGTDSGGPGHLIGA
jgi:DNA-binding response OmpR family regulator